MTIQRWDPFAEFPRLHRAMHRMHRLLDDFPAPWRGEAEMTFPVDVSETGTEVVVKAVLPGLKAEDIEISVTGDALTIKGETRREEKTERENYYSREIEYGSFSRVVPLPSQVDYDRAEAAFENGILTITLPKAEEVRSRQIKIKAGQP